MTSAIRQAAIGALVAVAVTLGAYAGPDASAPAAAPCAAGIAAPWPAFDIWKSEEVRFAQVLRACRDAVLDVALDALGDIAGHLKQV